MHVCLRGWVLGLVYMKAGSFGGERCWLSLELELQVVVSCHSVAPLGEQEVTNY